MYEQALRLSIDGLSSEQGSFGKYPMTEASFFSLGFRDFRSVKKEISPLSLTLQSFSDEAIFGPFHQRKRTRGKSKHNSDLNQRTNYSK